MPVKCLDIPAHIKAFLCFPFVLQMFLYPAMNSFKLDEANTQLVLVIKPAMILGSFLLLHKMVIRRWWQKSLLQKQSTQNANRHLTDTVTAELQASRRQYFFFFAVWLHRCSYYCDHSFRSYWLEDYLEMRWPNYLLMNAWIILITTSLAALIMLNISCWL